MIMTLKIRQMQASDKPVLMRILKNTPEFKPSEVIVAEEVIDGYLRDIKGSGYYTLVAEVDSEVVGYVSYGNTPLTEGTWDVYWLAVAQEKRHLGLGRKLMAAAENDIRKMHGRLAFIETSATPEYERTIRFHTNQGYETICRIPDFYSVGDDKLIMQKRLT